MKYDRGADIFAEPRMRQGEGRRLTDRGMAEQRLLDVVRRDLLAAAIDDLLGAADDPQEAVIVDGAKVAGGQPAVLEAAWYAVDAVEKVAGHDARSAQDHLTGLAPRKEGSLLVANRKLAFGDSTDRTRPGRVRRKRRC